MSKPIDLFRKWSEKHKATWFWTRHYSNYSLQMYALNGHTFLVQTYEDGGFEIFIPASKTNNIKETLDAVEAYAKD